jgi:Pyruvate/2-oxoacid:ferredoxin oxidoreductase delta subunit
MRKGKSAMKTVRKIIEIDEESCNGCGACMVSCAEGALQIVDGKAKLVADKYCDGLGACLGECPIGALRIIERQAEEFDEAAVEHHLAEQQKTAHQAPDTLPCGCPSTHLRVFGAKSPCQEANQPMNYTPTESALTHWPVQIRLVPAEAPFLKNADLLVGADCTAIAYPNFHRDLLTGKVVLMGCPKFDDVQSYVEKFTDIFRKTPVKSVTVVVMEVPCCQGLPVIVKKAMDNAGKAIPMEYVMIGLQGDILKRERLVA